ncbi:MFS transporter [Cohnella lubricantis]|uniref:MFS transporter n=1 Tax=Cohnella lubricantis TaxID=2163172 RepID=A0A841T9T7_9BACL|nr:MFS transporter [Cohnella lubricantis]MBB6678273.1 MFS transporter [Cohnella lubricantis]MBP2118475.1 MFS family permease [Cohnella lubricantis]
MKTAVWLYLFLFVAMFDLHAQYPMLTPFAVSLGAAPSFIGLVMGMYSLTHLPGNLLAGYGVDRYGSRYFIAASLAGAGILLILQSRVTDPWHLLYIRSISGFVLAFLSPACLSLLAKLAKNHIQQGKLMAGNGLVHTIASVVSPAAGAWLAARIGFTESFLILGWILLATGISSLWFVREPAMPQKASMEPSSTSAAESRRTSELRLPAESARKDEAPDRFPWIVFLLPVAVACSQGILAFELPFEASSPDQLMDAGLLFSVISLGSLSTLALLFLQRYLPYARNVAGLLLAALAYYGIAAGWPVPLMAMLFVIGMAKGIIFPAMTSFLLQLSGPSRFGRTFSFLSIAMSIGSFLGPVLAGASRSRFSPYFIAFAVLMTALVALMPRPVYSKGWNAGADLTPPSGH